MPTQNRLTVWVKYGAQPTDTLVISRNSVRRAARPMRLRWVLGYQQFALSSNGFMMSLFGFSLVNPLALPVIL